MVCITCGIVSEYVSLANGFTQDLAATLLPGMWALFGAIVGIWIILHGYQFIISGKGDIYRFATELIPVMIAALLLHGQGPTLVNSIYYAALNTMGAAAGLALSVGGDIPLAECSNCSADNTGLVSLVAIAEKGVVGIFAIGENIVDDAGGIAERVVAVIYAVLLVLPYFIVLIVFFSQVVIAIFRVLMIAALSPFLMLGFAFGWGRQMSVSGLRTILASFMVLFGCTCALAVMLYGVKELGDLDSHSWSDIEMVLPHYLVALALGWMGSAFMTEATAIANSITGSVLTNSGLAILTGAGIGTSYAAARFGASKGAAGLAGAGGLAKAGMGAAGGAVAAGAIALAEKFKNHNGGFNK